MNKYIKEIERSKKYLQIIFAFMLISTSINFQADENSPEIEKEKSEKTTEVKKDRKNQKKESSIDFLFTP